MHSPASRLGPAEQLIVVGRLVAPQIHSSAPVPKMPVTMLAYIGQSNLIDVMSLKTELRRLSSIIQVAQSNGVSP